MRYDHGRENLDQNAFNFLLYEDKQDGGRTLFPSYLPV
jgi:hypothetical protein